MKITIIGSTSYIPKILKHKEELEAQGHEVFIPAFDHHPEFNELQICDHNIELIRKADRVDLIWDSRSDGVKFDLGVTRALDKPFKLIYLNDKTFINLVKQMDDAHKNA